MPKRKPITEFPKYLNQISTSTKLNFKFSSGDKAPIYKAEFEMKDMVKGIVFIQPKMYKAIIIQQYSGESDPFVQWQVKVHEFGIGKLEKLKRYYLVLLGDLKIKSAESASGSGIWADWKRVIRIFPQRVFGRDHADLPRIEREVENELINMETVLSE